jgi:hypothetical protein
MMAFVSGKRRRRKTSFDRDLEAWLTRIAHEESRNFT